MRAPFYLFSTTLALVSSLTNGCAMFEFFNFTDLPEGAIQAAMDLGYDEVSWEDLRTNPIERIKYSDLMNIGEMGGTIKTLFGDFTPQTDDLKGALMNIDFGEDGICWDFWVNHYDGYGWDELGSTLTPFGDNVQDLLKMIGWDKDSWDDEDFTSEIPEAECTFWFMLDPIQKYAYTALGWNPASFAAAPCDPRCPMSPACPDNEP